jgi:hypothetical protein
MDLKSDDGTTYLINGVDKGAYLLAGFVYTEPNGRKSITVSSDDGKTFNLTMPETLKTTVGHFTGVNFKFDYGN